MKQYAKEFLLAFLAGISISLGCLIYLLCENSVIGAMFFTTGLFLVLTRGYNLFTGKVAYLFDNKKDYIFKLIWMWFGNFIGALLMAIGVQNAHIYTKISEKATNIIATKTGQGYLSAFILAMLCGVIIFLAVENYKNNPHEIGKYLGLLFLIPLFIICGFEHCVANMFYFSLTSTNVLNKVIYSLIITLGNSLGSIIANKLKKCK